MDSAAAVVAAAVVAEYAAAAVAVVLVNSFRLSAAVASIALDSASTLWEHFV